jgi:hypothetical protein
LAFFGFFLGGGKKIENFSLLDMKNKFCPADECFKVALITHEKKNSRYAFDHPKQQKQMILKIYPRKRFNCAFVDHNDHNVNATETRT